jgi:hypothetical protein
MFKYGNSRFGPAAVLNLPMVLLIVKISGKQKLQSSTNDQADK